MRNVAARFIAVGIAVLLFSCDAPKDDPVMDSQFQAQQKMKEALRDSDSAKYRDVQAYEMTGSGRTGYVFCGKVNAKNGFGGYSGAMRFVAGPGLATIETDEGGQEAMAFEIIWKAACAKWVKDVSAYWQ